MGVQEELLVGVERFARLLRKEQLELGLVLEGRAPHWRVELINVSLILKAEQAHAQEGGRQEGQQNEHHGVPGENLAVKCKNIAEEFLHIFVESAHLKPEASERCRGAAFTLGVV